ncbi:uncharacterized protein LOC127736686 isoform X6 [Mytilus californianus]|uniref:uncharacterized protein LOC127736686 isoform X5 n=1 Tax=Mytilus californianus TaxID=6549 RepID=UPI0022455250|nr:uncharacterized protein LOC127736686 isoform X5 [Mytilus californianus]XP_052103229.1 uncharacterized protein LOC127736686 isoform X6 [Mytilus californianus]
MYGVYQYNIIQLQVLSTGRYVQCMVYTNITSSSFRYYLQADEEPDEASRKRVKMVAKKDDSEPYDINVICNPVNGPSSEEYHVLVRQGRQSTLNQYLPDILLGVFSYSVNDGDSSYCTDGSLWDSCTYKTSINLNYTLCSTVMFGSATGHVYSVTYVLQGSTYYATVINSDGQDTLFTCLAVVSSGGKIAMSTNPGSCEKGQTPSSRTSNQESALITLSQYAFNSDSLDLSSDTDINIPAIVLGICAALVFIIVALSAFILYRKCYRRRTHIHHAHRDVLPDMMYPKKTALADAGIGDVVLHSPRI